MKATFALLPGRVGCNLGFVWDEEGPGLKIIWCEDEFYTGVVLRRGDGLLPEAVFDNISELTI